MIVGAVAMSAALFLIVEMFSAWVQRNVWTQPDRTNTIGSTLERLSRPGALFDSVVGQVWYVLIATALFGGLGFWVLVRSALGSLTDTAICRRTDAFVVVGLVVPLVGVSMLFMAGRDRPDMLIYGRYNEAILWPVVAIGAVWLLRMLEIGEWNQLMTRFAVTATICVGLTAIVAARSGDGR